MCSPGVSINTSWSAPLFTMPLIAFLVVCGIDDTMLIFSPLAVFKKVDLPADGRPMMDTIPALVATASPPFSILSLVSLMPVL